MRTRIGALLVVALVAQLGVSIASTSIASASTGPGDDRQQTAPTGWWTYTGVTASTLSTIITQDGARITSLQVDDPTVPTFTAVLVQNAGTYGSGWWWYYGQTVAQVSALLTTNHARLISASPYQTSGGLRLAVVMIPNTGTNQKPWWWYVGSVSFLTAKLTANHARMIVVNPVPGSTTSFLGIMVANTGSNATAWWWYVHASPSFVSSHLSTNHARLIDLSRNPSGSFNVVMYRNTGIRWYWYYGSNPATAVQRAGQQGERIIDADSYVVGGTKYFAVVETRNTNALSEKLWNLIGPTVPNGAYGFYLKLVGGGVLAGLDQSNQYEPASALKVLYHAMVIHQESLGLAGDGDAITYHYDPANPGNQGICPDNFPTTSTTTLLNADQQMMWNSDNRMTRGIVEDFTKAAILRYGATLGLTSTAINHNIGCPTPTTHNKTTLVDLGRVYEAFANGTVTSNGGWEAQFASRMLNQSNYPPFKNGTCPIVNQEAAKLGKSSATATSFCNAMTWVSKGGSYQYGSLLPYGVSWDGVALTGLPFKSGGVTTIKYYIFGEYVDGTIITSTAEASAINSARANEYLEAMRPFIHQALATWS
jgi:hypothetical protein